MNLALDPTTVMLSELAQGKLAPAARRELAQRALREPGLAAELKLALRLADGGAAVARDWVAVAAQSQATAHHGWWRPLAGAAASLAIVAAVLSVPRITQVDSAAPVAVAQLSQQLPDRIGAASFDEGSDLFGGSFEAN